MLYNLASGPPEPGTLLESIFLLVTRLRQESRYLETRLLVEALLSAKTEGNSLQDSYNQYTDAMFPFAAATRDKNKKKAKKVMEEWVGKKALRVRALADPNKKVRSKMHKATETAKPAKGVKL